MLAAASKSSASPVDCRNSLLVSPLPPTQTRFHPASKPWLIQFWEVPFWKGPFLGKWSGQPMFLSLSTTKNPGRYKTSTRRHSRQRGSELFGLSFCFRNPRSWPSGSTNKHASQQKSGPSYRRTREGAAQRGKTLESSHSVLPTPPSTPAQASGQSARDLGCGGESK